MSSRKTESQCKNGLCSVQDDWINKNCPAAILSKSSCKFDNSSCGKQAKTQVLNSHKVYVFFFNNLLM